MDDLLAEVGVGKTDLRSLLRDKARRRHTGQGVDLEAPGLALVVEDEVGAGIDREPQRAVQRERHLADLLPLIIRDGSGADLLRAARLILADVVKELALRDDLDRGRTYFKLLTQVVRTGQERGELSRAVTANEIVKAYAMFERALMYDWCLCEGEYALSGYAARMMPVFLEGFHTKNADLS